MRFRQNLLFLQVILILMIIEIRNTHQLQIIIGEKFFF